MKWLLFSIVTFWALTIKGQYIYVQSVTPFTVLTSANSELVTSLWIKQIDESKPISIKLSSGKILHRHFKATTPKAYYQIDGNTIRYRPNSTGMVSDTIDQPILTELPERDLTKMTNTISRIKALQYEFEIVEAVKTELNNEELDCEDVKALISCAKYDSSKVELINKAATSLPEICINELKLLVAESYRALIK